MRRKPYFIFPVACVILALAGPLSHPVQAPSVPVMGVVPLVAYSIAVSAVHETGATVTWNTNGDANSTVEYGTTIAYGSVRTDPAMVITHTITLDGLSPGTLYHFRIISADLFGNLYTSADMQFTTTGPVPGPGGGGSGSWSTGIPLGIHEAPYNCVITPVTRAGIRTSGRITSTVSGMVDIRASWTANITEIPRAGASIVTCLRSQPSNSTRSSFDATLASQGLRMTGLAYVMEVTRSHPIGTGNATIQMDVNRSWVSWNGGVNGVRIIREGDDGLVQVLETRFSNYDLGTGYMNFRAFSPAGLSVYALIAVKAAPGMVPASPEITPAATAAVPPGTGAGAPALTWIPKVVIILAIIVIITVGLIRYKRAKRT